MSVFAARSESIPLIKICLYADLFCITLREKRRKSSCVDVPGSAGIASALSGQLLQQPEGREATRRHEKTAGPIGQMKLGRIHLVREA